MEPGEGDGDSIMESCGSNTHLATGSDLSSAWGFGLWHNGNILQRPETAGVLASSCTDHTVPEGIITFPLHSFTNRTLSLITRSCIDRFWGYPFLFIFNGAIIIFPILLVILLDYLTTLQKIWFLNFKRIWNMRVDFNQFFKCTEYFESTPSFIRI